MSETSPTIQPGQDGTPVPSGHQVIRMSFVDCANLGCAPATAFALSSVDKFQAEPRLSVWVRGLTTFEQAWTLSGRSRDRRVALILGSIRFAF